MHKKLKFLLLSITSAISVATVISSVSCNMSLNFKPAFFNYQDYSWEKGINKINEKFQYKQFGDLPEFERALKENKTVGGIGSDYYIIKWIKEKEIKKIDFSKAFNMNILTTSKEVTIKSFYTDVVWNHMKNFDTLLGDIDGDGINDHLWEYMIPYFMQYKVGTFNLTRGNWSNSELAILNGNNQNQIDNLFKDNSGNISYLSILKKWYEHGYTNLVINDYMRDNMMIGSEKNGNINGAVSLQNYKGMIDDFFSKLSNAGYSKNNLIFESSGVNSLDHLIDPNSRAYGASFLYNGDALYATYGGSFEGKANSNDQIRIVRPNNPIFLLDGIVISSGTNGVMENNFYDSIYNAFINGHNSPYSDVSNNSNNVAFNNFDNVGYTTPFTSIYNSIKNSTSYFDFDYQKLIFEIENGNLLNGNIKPISNEIQTKSELYYEESKN